MNDTQTNFKPDAPAPALTHIPTDAELLAGFLREAASTCRNRAARQRLQIAMSAALGAAEILRREQSGALHA